MNYQILVALLVILFPIINNAQPITFDKSLLAGPATQILQTDDGGYLVYCPTSDSRYTLNDITYIKTDQFGFTEWIKSYSDVIRPTNFISKTLDGGYASAGSKMNGLLEDIYLIIFDQNLDTVWTKTFGNQEQQEFGHSIIQLPDSSFILASRDAGYIHLRKLNKFGGLIWYKNVGNSGGLFGSLQSVLLNLNDGTFFLFAPINNSSLIRMNGDSDTIWIKTNISIRNCFFTNDGFVLLSTASNLQKLDLNGNLMWQKNIAVVSSCTQSSNGNYILLKDGNNIIETDTSGNILSSTPILEYTGKYIASTPDGGIIIGGSNDDYNPQYFGNYTWFRKTDNNFNYNAINLRLPADGDRLSISETYPIVWRTNSADYVNLDYSTDNQLTWNTIIHYYPAEADTFYWNIPSIPAGDLYIKISDSFNPDLYDRSDPPQKAVNYHSFDYIAANEIFMRLRNDGMNAHNPDGTGTNGFLWPGGIQATIGAIFQDGLVWGGKVNGEIRVNGNTYRAGLQPGYILPNGMPSDPLDVKSKMFKLKKNWQFLPPGPERSRYEFDYLNWPVDLGAPWDDNNNDGIYTLGIDNPRILGEETLFFVANDLDTSRSTFTYGSTPIGLELQVTTFGYNSELLKDVVFKKFKIINKSENDITDMYLSYWTDDDLGNAVDDYVGCDTLLNLGFTYNGDNDDQTSWGGYGTPPPSVGHLIVQPPIVAAEPTDSARFGDGWKRGYKNLPLSGFTFYIGGSNLYADPELGVYAGTLQMYNNMQGLVWDGVNFIDPNTNLPTHFCLAGDPVAGTGWYEGPGWPGGQASGDRRYLASVGKFNMAANDTQEVVIALLIKKGNDNINSVTELKNYAAQIQQWYDNDFVTDVEENNILLPTEFSLSQNYPNPFNPSTTIQYAISSKQLVQLKVYDILGSEVATLVNKEQSAGSYKIDFNASQLSSGVYFYRLSAGSYIQTKKMILVK